MSATAIGALRGWDLIRATLAGGPVATPAIAFWKHHPLADQHAEQLADATIAFQRQVDCDLIKLCSPNTFQIVDYGLKDEWRLDPVGRRTVTHRPIETPDDWRRLRRRRSGAGFTAQMLVTARLVRRAIPREIPLVATIFTPLLQAVNLAGIAQFLEHTQSAPGALAEGVDVITANTVDLIEAFRNEGADGIFLATQHASLSALADSDYNQWGRAGDNACARAMQGSLGIAHLHGEEVDFARCPDGIDILHYDSLAPGNPGVDEALGRFKGTVSSAWQAPDGEAPPSRRFILSAGCVVPIAVPNEELVALVSRYRNR